MKEKNGLVYMIVMSHRFKSPVSNMVYMTLFTAFLEYGTFVIHELLLYPRELSYEFCRRMELLPADVHRNVALVEIPSTS